MRIRTKNESFNESWEYLLSFHCSARLPNGKSIDLTKKPRLSQDEWGHYIHALIGVLKIGSRNSWLHIHPDGKGRLAYLYIPKDFIQE